MLFFMAIRLMMLTALLVPVVLLLLQCPPQMKRVLRLLLAVLAGGTLLAVLATTNLTYDRDTAGRSAALSAKSLVKEECGFSPQVVVRSVEEYELKNWPPNNRIFDVRVDIFHEGNSIGEVYTFVSDNIKVLGIPITDNEITANTVRCK